MDTRIAIRCQPVSLEIRLRGMLSGSGRLPSLPGSTKIPKIIAIIIRVSVKPGISMIPCTKEIISLYTQMAFTRSEWIYYQKRKVDAMG